VLQRWFSLGLYNNYTPVFGPCGTWVSSMGRDKYLNAIYTACSYTGGSVYNMCVGWYNANQYFYTKGSAYMVRELLYL